MKLVKLDDWIHNQCQKFKCTNWLKSFVKRNKNYAYLWNTVEQEEASKLLWIGLMKNLQQTQHFSEMDVIIIAVMSADFYKYNIQALGDYW